MLPVAYLVGPGTVSGAVWVTTGSWLIAVGALLLYLLVGLLISLRPCSEQVCVARNRRARLEARRTSQQPVPLRPPIWLAARMTGQNG